MGCTTSSTENGLATETRANKSIDLTQRQAKLAAQTEVKVLLIGAGDSGKTSKFLMWTTLRKQLANLHASAMFNDPSYRTSFATTITENILEGTSALLGLLDDDMYRELQQQCKLELSRGLAYLEPKTADMIINLCSHDEKFMEALTTRASEVHLQDCYVGFVQELKAYPLWGGQRWIPCANDCVRARVRTSGVVREHITVEGTNYAIIDVGGQRAERRKWLHSFEDCTGALFVTSLAEYDLNLFEDSNKNRLEESLELFQACVESRWLEKAVLMLFLNKKDLFDQKFKIKKIPLDVSGRFPTAPRTCDDERAAIEWITNEFKAKTKRKPRDMYVHTTTAIDPSNVRAVFGICRDIMARKALKAAGFMI